MKGQQKEAAYRFLECCEAEDIEYFSLCEPRHPELQQAIRGLRRTGVGNDSITYLAQYLLYTKGKMRTKPPTEGLSTRRIKELKWVVNGYRKSAENKKIRESSLENVPEYLMKFAGPPITRPPARRR